MKEHLTHLPHKLDTDKSLETVVRELVEDGAPLDSEQLFNDSPAKPLIGQRLHKFTHYNRALLPMFAHPDQV